MAQQLSDEEQLQILKNWWRANSTFLIVGLALAVCAYFGWQWWRSYQQNYALGASAVYLELINTLVSAGSEQLSDDKYTTAKYLIKQLQDDYDRSIYAFGASLIAANLAVNRSDLETAESELLKALELSDGDTRPLVELRLGKVLLAQKKYDQALDYANRENENTSGVNLSHLFAALRGDIEAARGNKQAARTAYQQAMADLDNNDPQKQILEIKLSNLAEGEPS